MGPSGPTKDNLLFRKSTDQSEERLKFQYNFMRSLKIACYYLQFPSLCEILTGELTRVQARIGF